jgi:hypothetical protein
LAPEVPFIEASDVAEAAARMGQGWLLWLVAETGSRPATSTLIEGPSSPPRGAPQTLSWKSSIFSARPLRAKLRASASPSAPLGMGTLTMLLPRVAPLKGSRLGVASLLLTLHRLR